MVLVLAFVATLFIGSGAYWLTRHVPTLLATRAKPDQPPAPPPPSPTNVATPPRPEYQGRQANPFGNDTPPQETHLGKDAEPTPLVSAAPELTQDELEKKKRRVKIKMFMSKKCELCDFARNFMISRNYTFEEVDVEASETDKVLLESLNPQGTVPTFEIDGKPLVGYDVNIFDSTIEKAARARLKK